MKRSTALATLLAVSATAFGTFASQAGACTTSDHCYAFEVNYETLEGTWVDILTTSDSVPGWNAGDRLQNEEWTLFPDGGWLEIGDTTGTIGYNSPTGQDATSTPVYFYADAEPLSSGLTEYDLPDGPGLGNWFYVQEGDLGNGVWCQSFNGVEVACLNGLPLYSTSQEAGLEVAANTPPVNNGTLYTWGEQLGTGAWLDWLYPTGDPVDYDQYIDSLGVNDNYCIFPVSDGTDEGAAFATPNPNPDCYSNQGVGNVARESPLLRNGASELSAGASAPPPAPPGVGAAGSLPSPAGGFHQSTAPPLSASDLAAIAAAAASRAGDPNADVQGATRVDTSLESAMQAVDPRTEMPTSMSDGYRNLLNSSTSLLVLHGNFSLSTAPKPPSANAPSGSVLEIVVDDHTGWIDMLHGGRCTDIQFV